MDEVVKLLEALEKKCPSKEFNSLCLCLTVESLSDHPAFASWSVAKGRLDCFQMLLGLLGNILPGDNQIPGCETTLVDTLALGLALQVELLICS